MRAVEHSQFGPARADLIASMRSIEERARRVRRMVEAEEPTIDILSALCRLRADLRSFGMLLLRARLHLLSDIVGGGRLSFFDPGDPHRGDMDHEHRTSKSTEGGVTR